MTNVFVFIPAFGRQITSTTFEATHHLMASFMQKGIGASIATYSWPDIEEMRNVALSFWYDVIPQSTHMLFIDADMGFSPQMVLDMLAFGEPMVGAIYPKRTLPIEWAGSGLESAEVRGGFMEVEGLGMGCFLIRRDAIDKMVETYPELIQPETFLVQFAEMGLKRTLCFFDQWREEKGKVAEDMAFCKRWRRTGGKVWASIAYEIDHVGQHAFTGCFARDRQLPQEGQSSAA